MSEHKILLKWENDGSEFSYKGYNRNHCVEFSNKERMELSAAANYLGDPSKVDPEGLYVASLSSCHMLTFLAMAAKNRYVVKKYIDNAVGYLEKGEDGNIAVTKVKLNAEVEFEGDNIPDEQSINLLHKNAHKYCFIANSVKTVIEF